MSTALRVGFISPITVMSTLADGLAGNLASDSITVDLIRRYVQKVVTVTEAEIVDGIRYLVCEHGVVAEGAAPLLLQQSWQVKYLSLGPLSQL